MMMRQKNRTALIFMALFLFSANATTLALLSLGWIGAPFNRIELQQHWDDFAQSDPR